MHIEIPAVAYKELRGKEEAQDGGAADGPERACARPYLESRAHDRGPGGIGFADQLDLTSANTQRHSGIPGPAPSTLLWLWLYCCKPRRKRCRRSPHPA